MAKAAGRASSPIPDPLRTAARSRRSEIRAWKSRAVKAQVAESVDGHGQHLGIGSDSRLPDDVDVPLEVLPEAAPLLALVSEELGKGEPANGLGKGPAPVAENASQGRCHLRPERHLSPTLVLEVIQLPDDLLAALLGVELQRFQGRAIVLLKAVAPGDPAPAFEHMGSDRQILGREVPEPG